MFLGFWFELLKLLFEFDRGWLPDDGIGRRLLGEVAVPGVYFLRIFLLFIRMVVTVLLE